MISYNFYNFAVKWSFIPDKCIGSFFPDVFKFWLMFHKTFISFRVRALPLHFVQASRCSSDVTIIRIIRAADDSAGETDLSLLRQRGREARSRGDQEHVKIMCRYLTTTKTAVRIQPVGSRHLDSSDAERAVCAWQLENEDCEHWGNVQTQQWDNYHNTKGGNLKLGASAVIWGARRNNVFTVCLLDKSCKFAVTFRNAFTLDVCISKCFSEISHH